ncbi:hypothetical protein F4778DRAFT_67911 [Xylariomycetidae sp. FL2044]|nr:hypothetical protein F4778DRAFT_67911 [Xylariomycetidae sp. FL2044]
MSDNEIRMGLLAFAMERRRHGGLPDTPFFTGPFPLARSALYTLQHDIWESYLPLEEFRLGREQIDGRAPVHFSFEFPPWTENSARRALSTRVSPLGYAPKDVTPVWHVFYLSSAPAGRRWTDNYWAALFNQSSLRGIEDEAETAPLNARGLRMAINSRRWGANLAPGTPLYWVTDMRNLDILAFLLSLVESAPSTPGSLWSEYIAGPGI